MGNDFLARIKLALDGKEQVIAGLTQTEQAAQKLSKIKVVTTFDKEGVATGKQLEETFRPIGENAKVAAKGMNDFEKAMNRALIVAPVWLALRAAMMSVFNLIKEQSKFLVDMEEAMARMQIVGKGTREEFDLLKVSLIALSNAYGLSASEALNAAKIFAQQGRDVNQTFLLTKTAMMGAAVLGTDIETSVNDLTAAIEGFNVPVSRAVNIVDKWVAVEKAFAVTSKDLADATKVAGASANQLGISIDDFLGDVTAVVEVTRKSGSEAARGLSFIYARLLTTAKPVIEQITKTKFYLDAQGQSTDKVTKSTRNLSDIIGDIATKWGELTVQEKLEIATSLGSKRQMVVVNALMQNYNRSLDARITSLTAAGQSQKAFNILLDTAAYKSKQVGSAWNALTFTIADTSAYKSVLDYINKVLIGWSSLIDKQKGLSIVMNQIASEQINNIEAREGEINSIEQLINIREKLNKLPVTSENIKRIEEVDNAIKNLAKSYPNLFATLEKDGAEAFKKSVQEQLDLSARQKLSFKITADVEPQIATLERKKLQIQYQTYPKLTSEQTNAQVGEIDKQILELRKKQTDELEKQYSIYKSDAISKRLDDMGEEEQLSETLTEKEKEQLDIERQLSIIKLTNNDNLEKQVSAQIELTKNSKFIYDAHEKTLQLEKLHNDLIDARLKKREEEKNKLENLLFQYEKASGFEKTKLRRQMELSQMQPTEVVTAYQSTSYDKNLILQNISSFSEEIQNAIAQIIAREQGLSQYNKVLTPTTSQAISSINQTANFGNITVNLPEGSLDNLANKAAKEFENKLKNDEDLKNFLAKQIRPYM